jgi:large subunit ribosomal protein L7/L12
MSINQLKEQATGLSDYDKFDLICCLVGELPASAIGDLIGTVESAFGVKAKTAQSRDMNKLFEKWLEDRKPIPPPPTEFDVYLTEIGPAKIKVIKEVRGLTGLGLREAKNLVDSAPNIVKEKLAKEQAEELQGRLQECGAGVEIRPSQA